MAKRVLKTALVGGALLALAACNASKNDSISGGSLDDAEKASEALLKTGGNQRRAATLLGVKNTTLHNKIKTLGITSIKFAAD